MEFIKEESEDIKIEETFTVKQEDAEEQTGWFSFSKLNSLVSYELYIFLPFAGVFVHCPPAAFFFERISASFIA